MAEPRDSQDAQPRLDVSPAPAADDMAARIALRRSPRARVPRTPPLPDAPEGQQSIKRKAGRRRYHRKKNKVPLQGDQGDNTVTPSLAEAINSQGATSSTTQRQSIENQGQLDSGKKSRKRPRKPQKKGKGGAEAQAEGKSNDAKVNEEDNAGAEAASSPPSHQLSLSAAPATNSDSKPKRKRRRTPYSKRTWQEQMDLLNQEVERAERQEQKEEARLRRLKPEKLAEVRLKAPRNTTQFLINTHASDNDESHRDSDDIEIDEHGTMAEQSDELFAIREELRKRQRLEFEATIGINAKDS